ncbi:glycerol 3-phosphate dehydrogenase-like isoform X1 [Ptychodera flava]|uniref:glycerol 3-phosphate dehydrogenase-like isoform X1 n=1 Tax=Ptychodera flava TaxID=63121 RepID=UPI00396A8521
MEKHDVVVVGGGVVGCTILHELTKHGYRSILCEKNPELVSEASSGNSGITTTGYDVDEPIELQLLQKARKLNEETYQKYNIPYRKSGAHLVAWTQDELDRLQSVIDKAHEVGVHDLYQLSKEKLRQREPHLSHDALGAVFIPGEMPVDSWLMPITLAHDALLRGAKILRNCKITNGYRTSNDDWILMTTTGPIRTAVVINCAGLYGDNVENINQSSPFQIKPRKGQYVVFERCADEVLNTAIFPFPTKITRGVLLFPSVYGHIVAGPTAEEQDSRSDRSTNPSTIDELTDYARKVLPALKHRKVIATYAGLRPGTNSKDYHIISNTERSWITVGGIRSTGVSASLAIAQHVREELLNKFHLKPSNQEERSFDASRQRVKPSFRVLPSGHVEMNGYKYKITHPLSRLGLLAKHKL